MLTERQYEILKALINEYIRTAEPISSDFLAKKYDFGLCPSAIRIEMQLLIKSGFLEQPHTSAGRVPTDRAYRFFVDNVYKQKTEKDINQELSQLVHKRNNDYFELLGHVAKFLADASSNLAIIHSMDKHISWKEGWDSIAKEPEFNDRDFAVNLLNFLDDYEEKIKELEPNEVGIYIGHEIPIPKARDLSLICSVCPVLAHDAFISIVGPKRMDYNRNINLIYSINKFLKQAL